MNDYEGPGWDFDSDEFHTSSLIADDGMDWRQDLYGRTADQIGPRRNLVSDGKGGLVLEPEQPRQYLSAEDLIGDVADVASIPTVTVTDLADDLKEVA